MGGGLDGTLSDHLTRKPALRVPPNSENPLPRLRKRGNGSSSALIGIGPDELPVGLRQIGQVDMGPKHPP